MIAILFVCMVALWALSFMVNIRVYKLEKQLRDELDE